jgi:hypothetical protein
MYENVWGDDVLFQGPSLDRQPMTFYPVVRIEMERPSRLLSGIFRGLMNNEGFGIKSG